MLSFLRKKSAMSRAVFALLVPVVLAGLLFASCDNGNTLSTTVNAEQPNITAQPAGGNWNVSSANTLDLTVTAASPDSGQLSYQWYSVSSAANTGGSAMDGKTTATLSLAKANYTINGSYYFYVVITNTIDDNGDGGNKIATKTSDVATVTVSGNTETPPKLGDDLNTNLIGKWMDPYGYECFTITANSFLYESIDWLNDDDDYDYSLVPLWGGSIVYVKNFDDTNGVIIIEYSSDLKQVWIDWSSYSPINPQPEGNFYGIYFSNLTTTTNPMTAEIFYTSDQNDNLGSTETKTLQEAIDRFTKDKKSDWIADGFGSAQNKQD